MAFMAWLRSAKLSAEPLLSVSSSRRSSTPARPPMASASASAPTVSNSTMLLRILTTWPHPTGPQCVMSVPMAARNGLIRAKSAADAPTMMLSRPCCAASRVRATGASANSMPASARRDASVRVSATGEVPQSTTMRVRPPAVAMPPGPRQTSSTCRPLGSDRKMSSARAASSAIDAQVTTPAAASRSSGSRRRSMAWTLRPALRARLAHMGSPMVPSPMKPKLSISGMPSSRASIRASFAQSGRFPNPLPLLCYRIHTSWLRSGRKTDSVIPLASDGVGHGIGVWAGAVWRPPPAKRGACLHEALVARPGSCIRRLGGTRSREMRFTRFLRNAAVTADEMSRHAGALTAERVAGREVVAIQDTSELVLGGRRARAAGYGPVGKGGALGGLLLHPVLAVEAGSGALLGLVSLQVWNRAGGAVGPRRKRATPAKESQRWLDGARQAGAVLAPAASITVVSDRESDFYELFAERPANVQLVVRACQNRRIETPPGVSGDGLMFSFVDGLPPQGRFVVKVPAAPGRKERTAELAVRFAPVVLRKPRHGAAAALPATVAVTLVDVRETAPPADGSEPIHWRLLTTHTVTHAAE